MKLTRFCIVAIFLTLLAVYANSAPLSEPNDEDESAIVDRIEQERDPKVKEDDSTGPIDKPEGEQIPRKPKKKDVDEDMNRSDEVKDRRWRPSRKDRRRRRYPDESNSENEDGDKSQGSDDPQKSRDKRPKQEDDEDRPRCGCQKYHRFRPYWYYRRYANVDDDNDGDNDESDFWKIRWGRGRRPQIFNRRYHRKYTAEGDDEDD